ncbi:IclR family transcriptional regulator [Chryseomicrobium imtechense]
MLNKTVVKSMEILHVFYDKEAASLADIMTYTGLPKTSAHRMAETLVEMGFLEKSEDHKYRLGLLFLKFGSLVAERIDLRRIAYPYMQQLRDEFGEAVNLIVRDGMEAVYIEKADTTERIRVYTQIGRRAPLYAGACPRVLFSYLPEQEQQKLADAFTFVQYAEQTPISKEVLFEKVVETKKSGWALSHSELESHSSAVAIPLIDYTGNVVGGMSFVGPQIRFTDENHIATLAKALQQAGVEISRKLGAKEDVIHALY